MHSRYETPDGSEDDVPQIPVVQLSQVMAAPNNKIAERVSSLWVSAIDS